MKFTIITPTTGSIHLIKLLKSINELVTDNLFEIIHCIVIDGKKFEPNAMEILKTIKPNKNHSRTITCLDFNTGANGYNGHKIYAGFIHLVLTDYIIFLDEDNWFDNTHLMNYYKLICKYNLDWCFCLRKIVSKEDNFLMHDHCESLGNLYNFFCMNQLVENENKKATHNLIDTNCYCISYKIAKAYSSVWNEIGNNTNTDPDRIFCRLLLKKSIKYKCTFEYTLNYRVANRPSSVQDYFFILGNNNILKTFGDYPWIKYSNKEPLYLIHFDPINTDKIIQRIYKKDNNTICYNQWNLNLLDEFTDILILNGFNKYIPSGSKILIHMCNPNTLPLDLLERTDLYKILYTIESPNQRHQTQWELNFLSKYFNKIITYWKPLIKLIQDAKQNSKSSLQVEYYPFTHRYNFSNSNDLIWIKNNYCYDKSVCIILENRNISGKYIINGIELESQDYLRKEYALIFGKQIHCYGSGWQQFEHEINYHNTIERFRDQEFTVDLMCNYCFCLIIENCNADGYISEKIYDALSAGCIPLYYGNDDHELVPSDCYIDIKKLTPKSLVEFINRMTENEIIEMKNKINFKRLEILKKVSIGLYNNFIKKELENYY